MSAAKLQTLGRVLKEARLAAGLRTQAAAVKALEERENYRIVQSLLAQYETGRILDPTPRLLQALARLYHCDYLQWVLTLAREKYAPEGGWPEGLAAERLRLWAAAFEQPTHVGAVKGFALEQTRAKADLVRRCEVLDLQGKVAWERKDQRNRDLSRFWVLAPRLRPSQEQPFLPTVVANLQRGVKYEHFIDPRQEEGFLTYKDLLQQHRSLRKVNVAEQVRGYRLDAESLAMLWTDYLVANPDSREAVVFQNLRYGGKTEWCVRLQPEEAWEFLAYWRQWVQSAERTA
jgi:transcriptional regulator with XRE-family HTH domain